MCTLCLNFVFPRKTEKQLVEWWPLGWPAVCTAESPAAAGYTQFITYVRTRVSTRVLYLT
jgi:hypothetical protein